MTISPFAGSPTGSKTPPFSPEGRLAAGMLLRRLQRGDVLSMPNSRPMPIVGPRCHELRIRDRKQRWRVLYRSDDEAILVVEIFLKKRRATPADAIRRARQRLEEYNDA